MKDSYINYCKENPVLIWAEPQWWDATANGQWEVAAVTDAYDKIIAAMPFLCEQKMGFKRLINSPLTHRTVLTLRYPKADLRPHPKISFEIETMSKLIQQLPKADFIELSLDYSAPQALAFHYWGFSLETRYTYVISGLSDFEGYYKSLKSETRKKVNPSGKKFEIIESNDADAFFRLNQLSFERQKFRSPYDRELFLKTDNFLAAQKKRTIFFAEKNGKKIAGFYLIWDKFRSYALANGLDANYIDTGAINYLTFHSIQYTSQVLGLDIYDMTGSMHPGIEPARRIWGGVLTPYLRVRKVNSAIIKLYQFLKGK